MDLIKCQWCGISLAGSEERSYECGECADLRHAVDRDRGLVRRMLKDADGCVIRNEAFEEEVKAVAKKQGKTMIEVAAAMFGVSPAFLDCADGLLKAAVDIQLKSSRIVRRECDRTFWFGSSRIEHNHMIALSEAIGRYNNQRSKV